MPVRPEYDTPLAWWEAQTLRSLESMAVVVTFAGGVAAAVVAAMLQIPDAGQPALRTWIFGLLVATLVLGAFVIVVPPSTVISDTPSLVAENEADNTIAPQQVVHMLRLMQRADQRRLRSAFLVVRAIASVQLLMSVAVTVLAARSML